MNEATDRLVHRLDLTPAQSDERSATWIGYAGEGALNMSDRLFGGMVLAQTVMAAGRTETQRALHSVQQVFLRGGRADVPLRYEVERLFVGQTYATVRVAVHQGDHVISHAQVGFSSGIDGPDRQEPSPASTVFDETVNRDEYRNRPGWQDQPVEVRVDPRRIDDAKPTLDTWLRPATALPDDPLVHQAVLAYVSDRAFMGVAWKPHEGRGTFKGATLDHSIWFHRPVCFDDWHVYSMYSPTIAGGRGLVQGAIHHRDGTRVATTTQQGTFRPV